MKFFLITVFGLVLLGILVIPWKAAHGATNIDSTYRWAWNDVVGWFNWYSSFEITPSDPTDDVFVDSQQLTGYVNSSIGPISLNCADISSCPPTGTKDYKVLNNGAGYLSGWAWNDTFGWFSFCGGGSRSDCPGTVYYQVHIDAAKEFRGYAWNDILGWVSLNCIDLENLLNNDLICGNTANFKVKTTWAPTFTTGYLESATIDTGDVAGAQFNSIVWRGSQPAGTMVKFKFAARSDNPAQWVDGDFYGDRCYTASYYESTGGPDKSIPLNYSCHNNKRYFRYRVYLDSDVTQTITPRVDDVIVNWSP